MSEPDNVLLIDVGNTQIKWAWAVTEGELTVVSANDADELSHHIKQARKVLVASVGRESSLSHIKALCENTSTVFVQIHTQKSSFDLKCAYENHRKLGVDRWLALLGANLSTTKNFAVIDIGTAMTCDFVVGNEHRGGWISPGFSLMRAGVSSQTQQVSRDNHFPTKLSLGQDTEECVNMGCLAAIQGQVKCAIEHLDKLTANGHIFISGGGQNLVDEIKAPNISYHKNLVLQGLQRFIDYQ